ncbi:MAG: hypothetical protein WAL25_01430 [Acidimicrobiia bacterium]
MSDEFPDRDPRDQPSTPPPPPGMPADEHDKDVVLAGAGDFTSGEGLIAFSGIVLLAIWVIFDVFLDEYGLGPVHILLAFTVVVVPRIDRSAVERVLPVPMIMKLAGYTIAILGVISIVGDIEDGVLDGFGTVIAALGSYGAYAMAFLGARQVQI